MLGYPHGTQNAPMFTQQSLKSAFTLIPQTISHPSTAPVLSSRSHNSQRRSSFRETNIVVAPCSRFKLPGDAKFGCVSSPFIVFVFSTKRVVRLVLDSISQTFLHSLHCRKILVHRFIGGSNAFRIIVNALVMITIPTSYTLSEWITPRSRATTPTDCDVKS